MGLWFGQGSRFRKADTQIILKAEEDLELHLSVEARVFGGIHLLLCSQRQLHAAAEAIIITDCATTSFKRSKQRKQQIQHKKYGTHPAQLAVLARMRPAARAPWGTQRASGRVGRHWLVLSWGFSHSPILGSYERNSWNDALEIGHCPRAYDAHFFFVFYFRHSRRRSTGVLRRTPYLHSIGEIRAGQTAEQYNTINIFYHFGSLSCIHLVAYHLPFSVDSICSPFCPFIHTPRTTLSRHCPGLTDHCFPLFCLFFSSVLNHLTPRQPWIGHAVPTE